MSTINRNFGRLLASIFRAAGGPDIATGFALELAQGPILRTAKEAFLMADAGLSTFLRNIGEGLRSIDPTMLTGLLSGLALQQAGAAAPEGAMMMGGVPAGPAGPVTEEDVAALFRGPASPGYTGPTAVPSPEAPAPRRRRKVQDAPTGAGTTGFVSPDASPDVTSTSPGGTDAAS